MKPPLSVHPNASFLSSLLPPPLPSHRAITPFSNNNLLTPTAVPQHMTEEMTHASREAPRSIIISVLLGAITGLIFLISASFCIGDFASTAATPTGVPLIQIFFDSTGSVAASCVLASMLVVVFLSATVFLTAEGSRSLFAFARDRGLPFSRSFVKVDARRQVPMPAILLGCAVQMVLNSIYFGTVTGFNTIIAVSTEGFCTVLPSISPVFVLSELLSLCTFYLL